MSAWLRLKRAHCCRGSAFAPPPGVTPYHSVGAIGSNTTFVPCGTWATSQSRVAVRVSCLASTPALRIVGIAAGISRIAAARPSAYGATRRGSASTALTIA